MKKWLHGQTISGIASLIGALVVCVYIPLVSYIYNADSFPFNGRELLYSMVKPFLWCFLILLVIIIDVDRLAFSRIRQQTERAIFHASPIHVLVFLLLVCVWLEGSFLNRGLPQLTGELDLFSSTRRLLLDFAVWVGVIGIGMLLWRRIARRMLFAFLAVTLLFAGGVADAMLHAREPIQTDVTAFEVLDQTSFDAENNVVVLILDAMSSALAQDYLAANPGAREALDGFVFFPNNLESSSNTQTSIPSIIKGELYTGNPIAQFQSDMFTSPQSMPGRFYRQGYDVYISSAVPQFNRMLLHEQPMDAARQRSVRIGFRLYGQLFVRFSPYVFKNAIANRVGFDTVGANPLFEPRKNLAGSGEYWTLLYDKVAYQALSTAIDGQKLARAAVNIHHVNGAHLPYEIDANGNRLTPADRGTIRGLRQQSTYTWRSVMDLLERMKAQGIYDSAAIALLGDHGDRQVTSGRDNAAYANHAALLIKPPHAHGPMVYSRAPTSNMYLADFLYALKIEGESLESITAGLPRERQIFISTGFLQTYDDADLPDIRVVRETEVEQHGSQPVALTPGVRYSLAYAAGRLPVAFPLAMHNADIINGWGFDIMAETGSVSFLVEGNPGEAVDVLLEPFFESRTGREMVGATFALSVRDQATGRIHDFTVDAGTKTIRLENIGITGESSIELELTVRPFDPDLKFSFDGITIEAR